MTTENGSPTRVTFVNRFSVQGDPGAFEKAFARVADFMKDRPGILGYTLSQDVTDPQRYVNVALWQDEASLRAAVAHPDFQQHVTELRQLAESTSELYAERHRYLDRDGVRTSE